MADIQHADIVDPYIHEPKNASTASSNTVYVSDGAGSGNWTLVGVSTLNYAAVLAELQGDINSGDLDLNGQFEIAGVITDVSTASSIIIPVLKSCVVKRATVVLGAAITLADSSVTFLNSAGASMGSAVTIPFTASAKGNQYAFTATGNNTLVGPTWIEIATNGNSTTAAPLYVLVEFTATLN